MTLNSKPQMDVVRREDKEGKLKSFISNYLFEHDVATPEAEPWLLVARSNESPVVQALASLAAQIKSAGYCVKTVISNAAPAVADSAATVSVGFDCELRLMRDIRLLDAHEQLRIDASTSWIGDCMRREPAKRDAYECYAAGYTELAAWNAKSFDRLWERSEPVLSQATVSAVETGNPDADVDPCVAQADSSSTSSTVVASTRH